MQGADDALVGLEGARRVARLGLQRRKPHIARGQFSRVERRCRARLGGAAAATRVVDAREPAARGATRVFRGSPTDGARAIADPVLAEARERVGLVGSARG